MHEIANDIASKTFKRLPPWFLMLMFFGAPATVGFGGGWFGFQSRVAVQEAKLENHMNREDVHQTQEEKLELFERLTAIETKLEMLLQKE